MIRHCVFIRFRSDLTSASKNSIFNDIVALRDAVPGILAVHVGVNVSPETGMDKGFSSGFIVDFDGAAARDAYLVHPDHEKAGARIVEAAEGGVSGILVYDLESVV
jgi:hypothetical protein